MKLALAIQKALSDIRHAVSLADGDEQAVLEEFIDQIGSEVNGWEDRVKEIKRDQDE